MKKKFRSSRDIPVLPRALFFIKKFFFVFLKTGDFKKKIQPYGHFGMGIISRIVTYKKHKKRKMLSPHRNHDIHYYFSKLCLQHTK